MLSKSEKIWINSLKQREIRHVKRQFLAEGSKLVNDLLIYAPENLQLVCATQKWCTKYEPIYHKFIEKCRIVEESILESVASLKSTEEVLAIFSFPDEFESTKSKNSLIIYLESIRDPGNFGTILRSADWFGIQKIYCSPDCVDVFNNKCVQSSMSSVMRVNVIIKSWPEFKNDFAHLKKFAATIGGTPYYAIQKKDVQLICIGNEASGLSKDILDECDANISIPPVNQAGIESLNAAVALSVLVAWNAIPENN